MRGVVQFDVPEPIRWRVVAPDERQEQGAGFRAERNSALLSAVCRLVLRGAVDPHLGAAVHFRKRQPAHFTRPHPREAL